MRIYLDEDVASEVKQRLEKKGHTADFAQSLGLKGTDDGPAYVEAVRRGYDLVITSNVTGKERFLNQTEGHLCCRKSELPVPIHELWEPGGIGNHWGDLEPRWPKHERQIEHLARQIEHTKPEKRHEEAIQKLSELEERATVIRELKATQAVSLHQAEMVRLAERTIEERKHDVTAIKQSKEAKKQDREHER